MGGTGLRALLLNGNQLTGSLPAAVSRLTALDTLLLGGNLLTGPVPDLAALVNLGDPADGEGADFAGGNLFLCPIPGACVRALCVVRARARARVRLIAGVCVCVCVRVCVCACVRACVRVPAQATRTHTLTSPALVLIVYSQQGWMHACMRALYRLPPH